VASFDHLPAFEKLARERKLSRVFPFVVSSISVNNAFGVGRCTHLERMTTDETLSSTANEAGGITDASPRGHNLLFVNDTGIRSIELPPGAALQVGRRVGLDIVVDHPAVSRDHAVFYGGEPPFVEDLGSRNGTTVQGTPIAPRQRVALRIGWVVGVGNSKIFVRSATGSYDDNAEAPSERTSPGLSQPKEWGPRSCHREVQELFEQLSVVAQSSIPILILGETGAGKELLAERVHVFSQRAQKPMLRINCAGLSEGILASELFGHEKGAFTGAHAAKIGVFEAADGGTLFMDEVGELSPSTQAKLLRVLETGEVTRVGSHKARHVDVRVISATNRDLRALSARGQFRSDLYFRLNGVSVTVPPLRRRPDDILPLSEFFIERFAEKLSRNPPALSHDAQEALQSHSWPGNVRELKHVLERAVLLCHDDVIEPAGLQIDRGFDARETEPAVGDTMHPPASSRPQRPQFSRTDRPPKSTRSLLTRFKTARNRTEQLKSELVKAERDRILDALEQAGTQAAAAELLGISRRALLYKLDTYGIPRPRKGRDKD
jgi:DNA-binding NtrC family response regulator